VAKGRARKQTSKTLVETKHQFRHHVLSAFSLSQYSVVKEHFQSFFNLVAGAGFEPATFGL